MKRKVLLFNALAIILGIALALGYKEYESRKRAKQGYSLSDRELKCVIELGRYSDSSEHLTAGYNYAILKKFAADMGSEVEISLSLNGDCYLDSLASGAADIVVRPHNDTAKREDILISDHVGNYAVWVVDGSNDIALKEINKWIDKYRESDEYWPVHNLYAKALNNPIKIAENGGTVRQLSPYDSLFRAYSGKLGWKWKDLAALAYQESRFHIEAMSWRGATGLMQMMPYTASRYERDNLLDPEDNIRAGVEYLMRLKSIFAKRVTADQLDLFMLAAYNAGEGRIIDCINYAQYKDVYDSTWSSVCAIIPEMSEDFILQVDTVKCGKFSGNETICFVDKIMALQEAFEAICPH